MKTGLAGLKPAVALSEFLQGFLSLLFPEVCQICERGRATPPEGFVCGDCRAQVKLVRRPFCERCGRPVAGAVSTSFECQHCRELEPEFDYARSAAVAHGVLLDIIHRYKYHRALWFEPFLGELLTAAAAEDLKAGRWDWLMPVPLHPTKRRERQFNQSERLAKALAGGVDLPMKSRLLRRVIPTRTQTALSREERLKNLRGAFAVRDPGQAKDRRIVLIDDVLTTGATTNECAKVLKAA